MRAELDSRDQKPADVEEMGDGGDVRGRERTRPGWSSNRGRWVERRAALRWRSGVGVGRGEGGGLSGCRDRDGFDLAHGWRWLSARRGTSAGVTAVVAEGRSAEGSGERGRRATAGRVAGAGHVRRRREALRKGLPKLA